MAAYVGRYAQAFLDVVTSAKLDTAAVDRQLGDFVGTWEGSAELQAFLTNPAVAAQQKVAILDKLNQRLALQTNYSRSIYPGSLYQGGIG